MGEKDTKVEVKRRAFALAWADPTSPTFQNGTQSYLTVYPEVKIESAQQSSIRMLRDARTQAMIAEFRQASKVHGALTMEQFVTWGWETLSEMRELMAVNPKYATAIAPLFEKVGKAMGFQTTKVEDVTPVERKFPPINTPEGLAAAREALDRFERLNTPNPLPTLPRVVSAKLAAEDAQEVEISQDTSTTTTTQDGSSEDHDRKEGIPSTP